MARGAASITINCSSDVVFDAITDVTRMGEWSPECIGGRWVPPATGPTTGASFEGDNLVKLGPLTIKKWTTSSEVTACQPGEMFEFVTGGYTSWRYELIAIDGTTRVTESFKHDDYEGFQKLIYGVLYKRQAAMVSGMEQTLERMKEVIEAAAAQ